MSILPGVPTSPPSPRSAEAGRIAGLAAMLAATPVAVVLAHETSGAHAERGHDDVVARGRTLCEQTAADGVLRVVADADAAAYVCVPIKGAAGREGQTVGALCVMDPSARSWTVEHVAGLTSLAELASAGLALRDFAVEREKARAELARDHAFLNAVLEHLTDGVAACDGDGQLVYFNPALREIHGLPEQTLSADEWANAYDLFDADGVRRLGADEIPLARAFAGEQVHNQHMVVRVPDRDPQHFLATGAPILDIDGNKLGAVVSMHDISADHRRRRVRTAHLAIATALSDSPGGDEAIATAMLHLRSALEPSTAGVVMSNQVLDDDIDARVVRTVTRSGVPVQMALSAPFTGYVACAPVVVAGTSVGVLYLAGPSRNLLDDLTASIVEGVAALLGRCLERERAERLDRELRATRHDLERVIRHAQDFVWSVEFLPSGRVSMRTTTSPYGVLGGAAVPDEGSWIDMLHTRVEADDMPELLRWRDDLLRGRPGEVTCRVRGEDGLVRWIRTRCSVRSEDGRRYVDGISSDVTGQTRFEVVRGTSVVGSEIGTVTT